jgi:hypothetical protein
LLADREKQMDLWPRIVETGRFLQQHLYRPQDGLFHDLYDPVLHSVAPNPYRTKNNSGGRPLLDDAIMLNLYRKTGNQSFRDEHLKISETLVAQQNPPGNWIDYGQCKPKQGVFHPRQTYWWGLPLIETFRETGRKEFLETAVASGNFCRQAIRKDGGYFRCYYHNGKTESFNHATSGAACAAILFLKLHRVTGDSSWMDDAELAINFCLKVQFLNPADSNLKGAILEKILPPDGTDRTPYYLRDLGTTFFILAAEKFLRLYDQ